MMFQRCENPNHKSYKNYGGRGISVCARWAEFKNFLADMGVKPKGKTLGRIKNNGNYQPSNCQWESWTEQARNRRTNTLLTHGGQTLTLQEWAEKIGIPRDAIGHRLKLGWPLEKALSIPARFQRNSRSYFMDKPSQTRKAIYMREVWRAS